jgi:hypothetical protein
VASDVGGESVRGVVAALAILLQTLHHDPIEITLELVDHFLDGVR